MTRGVNMLESSWRRRVGTRLASKAAGKNARRRSGGFTLLELMIVISIIMILMAVAVPMYNQSIVQARESVLRSNLQTLRNVI